VGLSDINIIYIVYEEMLRSEIQPSSSTYTILIRTLCKRDVEVQKVIAMLKRQNARSSHHQNKSNNMVELESEENLQKALVIFDAAVAENLVQFFDAELYNQILRVLSHYGNTEQSLHVYHQLELHSLPTSATFAALINLFGRVGDLASALTYFEKYTELKDTVGPHDASYVYNALVDAHLKCHNLQGALKIVQEDMLSGDVKISTIPYNSIIRYYCIMNQLEEAKALIETMKKSFPQPDASSYGPVLSSYCQLGDFKEASEMYQALIQTDISKSYGNLANYALLCLKDTVNSKKVISVVDDMRIAGLEPDAILAERIVTHFAKLGHVSDAIHALRSVLGAMKARSLSKGLAQIKNAAIQVAASAKGRFNQTLEVVRIMAPHCPHGLPLQLAKTLIEDYEFDADHDIVSESDYALLFDASITIASEPSRSKSSLSPLNIFVFCLQTEMAGKHFKVSSSIKSRVLSYFTRVGDKKSAQKWDALFKDNKIEGFAAVIASPAAINVPTESEEASNAVMKAAIHGQLEESLDIFRSRIIEANLIPTPEPLRDAIAFVGKQGHLEAAVTMYRLAIKCFKDSALDSQRMERAIYMMTNSILIGYAQQGDMVNAKKYYEQIKLMGRYPDGNGYASLLLGSAKCATDEATDALTIYDEAKRRDVKPTTFFYNVVISKLAKARKLDAAMKLFEEMQNFKVMPNSITYGAIISACVRAGSEPLARKLFSEMLASPSFQPRVGPFNNMIQFYVRQQPDRERALEYFAELRRRHIKPSAHTYKLLMEAYSLIAPYDMPTAHRMLSDMERCDHIRPQATHYATLIYSYGTLQRDVKSADRVFEDMEAKSVTKDEVVYQAMLDTLVSNDQLTRAEELYAKMQGDIQKSSSPYIENVFIRGYGQKGLLEKAKAMFDAMTDDKIEQADTFVVIREPSTYEAMVRAYVENKKMAEAKEIFELMVQREFPEKVTALVAELVSV
jgi:pentatricopeptide repeat protein